MYLWIKDGKKEKKVVQLFARITQSFLRNAFPAFKIYLQQSLGFFTIKVFKQRFILSKGCQGFNKGCCQYNLIKREMAGLFVRSRKLKDSKW